MLQHTGEDTQNEGPPIRTWWARVDFEDGCTQVGGQCTKVQKMLLEREAMTGAGIYKDLQ